MSRPTRTACGWSPSAGPRTEISCDAADVARVPCRCRVAAPVVPATTTSRVTIRWAWPRARRPCRSPVSDKPRRPRRRWAAAAAVAAWTTRDSSSGHRRRGAGEGRRRPCTSTTVRGRRKNTTITTITSSTGHRTRPTARVVTRATTIRRTIWRLPKRLHGHRASDPVVLYIGPRTTRNHPTAVLISLFDERVGLRCAWNLTEISRRPEGPISAGFDGRVLVSAQSYSLRVVLHSRVRGNYNTPAPYIPRLPVSPVLAPDALTPSSYLTPSYLIGTVPNRGIYSVHYNMIYILDFSMLRYFFSKYTKMTKYTFRWLTNQ